MPRCRIQPCLVCIVLTVLVGLVTTALAPSGAHADTVVWTTGMDNTLYQYKPSGYKQNDRKTWLRSNGSGDYFAAGLTNQRKQTQRGLLQFFLDPAIPAGAVIDSVSLRLYVVDSPTQEDPLVPRDFWLVAMPSFDEHWGAAGSVANVGTGGGSGADPVAKQAGQDGDATWCHTQYREEQCTQPGQFTGSPAATSPWPYPGTTGYWPQQTVTSPAGLTLTLGPGVVGDGTFTLPASYEPAGEDVGDKGAYVTWTTPQDTAQMVADVQRWIDDPAGNFGWLVIGEESYTLGDSSKRGFASFNNATADFRPQLTISYHFETAAVPEPAAAVLLASLGAMGLFAAAWRRAGCRRTD